MVKVVNHSYIINVTRIRKMLLNWIMRCIQLTTVIINTVKLGMSLQDNKGSSRATFVLSHLQVHNHIIIIEYSIYTAVLCIYHMQKEWREDYRGAFRKNVQRCVRRSQDML